MESRIKVAGHPLHPMLIVFPLGLLAIAVAFDIAALLWRQRLVQHFVLADGRRHSGRPTRSPARSGGLGCDPRQYACKGHWLMAWRG
jgi:uncharacterized membrane protein